MTNPADEAGERRPNWRKALEDIAGLTGEDVEQGPEIAETALEAIDHFAALTLPEDHPMTDISDGFAAGVEAAARFVEAHQIYDGSGGQGLSLRSDGNRAGLAYATGIRTISAARPHEPSEARPAWLGNCCVCGRVVDTREAKDGGDPHGAELSDGRWACSFDCWEAIVGDHSASASDALAPAAGQPVEIKLLEWTTTSGSSTMHRAESVVGSYRVWTFPEAEGWFWSSPAIHMSSRGLGSREEGFAAAQLDFDARIRSALAHLPRDRKGE